MSLEQKILKAFEAAVDDGDVVDDCGPAFALAGSGFSRAGETVFMRQLLSSLTPDEKQELFIAWIVDMADVGETECILNLIVGHSYERQVIDGVANRLLKHWQSEVTQMLNDHNKPHRIEDYKPWSEME